MPSVLEHSANFFRLVLRRSPLVCMALMAVRQSMLLHDHKSRRSCTLPEGFACKIVASASYCCTC